MGDTRINMVWWSSCVQLSMLGIIFILVRDVAINTVFYDVFLSFNWPAYWSYFLSNRLPMIAALLFITPLAVSLILSKTLRELKKFAHNPQPDPAERERLIGKLLLVRRGLVGYFFGGVFLGLIVYTVRGLLRVELDPTQFFLEISPFGFSTLLLLYFCSLLLLWIDQNFKGLRSVLNFHLTGNRRYQQRSRTVGMTVLFCFGFVCWLAIYYGVIMLFVKTEILKEVIRAVDHNTAGESNLPQVYRLLRISLEDFSKRLAFYQVFDARGLNVDNYVLPQNFSDYLVFLPVFATAVVGFVIYLFSYARSYNEGLAQILQHVRAQLRREVGMKQQIVLQRFDDIGYLTGYLNLLFQMIHRFLKGMTDNTTSLLQQMNGAEVSIQVKVGQLYRLNTVFARNGMRIDSQVHMVSGTQYGIKTLNHIVEQIKSEVAKQVGQLELASQTVGEFNQTVARVAQHLQEVQSSMEKLGKVAHDGRKMVHQSFETVTQLAGISYRIRDIVNVIGRLSAQTRLLSMSAAIEAAHAESHGEGFSVVSSSVRQLSEDADVQNKAIRVQIKDMIHRVVTALDLSKNALSSLRGIQNGVLRSQRVLETIAQAIDTQSAETDKLAQQIEGLRAVANLILQDADAQIISLERLGESTERLVKVVDQLLSQGGTQMSLSAGVMSSLEDLRSQVDAGLDEAQGLGEALGQLRLD